MNLKKDVHRIMKDIREQYLPSSEKIVEEAFNILGYDKNVTTDYARDHFEEMLYNVWIKTLEVLENYEEQTYSKGIPTQLGLSKSNDLLKSEEIALKNGFFSGIVDIFQRWYPYLREMFLSIAQSRKTRGGRDFELQFGKMLDLINVPYQKMKRAYRVDFMIPDDNTFTNNPTSAAIASAKRTLRERWREVVEELYQMRSPNIFLVTADGDVSKNHIKSICNDYRIHLIVWENVKQKYLSEPLVLSYSTWVNERLPVLMRFWKR